MPRLFVAVWPPAEAVAALLADLDADPAWPPGGWRAARPDRWHLTVRFHGEGAPGTVARELESRAGGLRAPWLRLAGLVTFPGVLAAGVTGATERDNAALSALVEATGADPTRYRSHVTVARGPRGGTAPPRAQSLIGHRGPWWRPTDVRLVRSELNSGPPRYTVLHRVPLLHDPESDTPA